MSAMYMRVICDRKVSRFALNLKVELKHFDEKHNKAKSSMRNYLYVNSILGSIEKRAGDMTLEYQLNNKPLTYQLFKDRVMVNEEAVAKSEGSGDFYAFIKQRLSQSNFKYNTQRSYKTVYNALEEYSPKLTFNDLDYAFVIGFKNFLIVERKNIENAYNKKLSVLRALIKEAMRMNLMKENPFEDGKIKIRHINPHRIFLELHEVQKLQALYTKGILKPHQQNVLQYFLFACYTGLRFSDVEQFNTDMIINNKISIVAEKTNEMVVIPVLAEAKKLLPKEEKQFKVTSNQKTNEALKGIMLTAKIKKNVTFHTARHTFATIAVSCGIPIEVISKLLGHSDIKTTMIYAKIMDDVKVEAMKLWGKKKRN